VVGPDQKLCNRPVGADEATRCVPSRIYGSVAEKAVTQYWDTHPSVVGRTDHCQNPSRLIGSSTYYSTEDFVAFRRGAVRFLQARRCIKYDGGEQIMVDERVVERRRG
jgi:hypothetical protein